jgi:hypothetical protein
MRITKINPSRIYSLLLTTGLLLTIPQIAFASDDARRHGSDDSSPEPSHSESPHRTPSPSPSSSPDRFDDSSSATPTPISSPTTIGAGSNERLQVTDPTTKAVIKIERKQKNKRGVVSEDKFTGSFKLLVPTLSVGVNTNDDATSADIKLTFSRSSTAYAECSLDFDSIRRTRTGYRAEYKVSIEEKLKKGFLTSKVKKGACDVDLTTDGVQSDLPNLQNGDSFLVEVNGVSLISGSL